MYQFVEAGNKLQHIVLTLSLTLKQKLLIGNYLTLESGFYALADVRNINRHCHHGDSS